MVGNAHPTYSFQQLTNNKQQTTNNKQQTTIIAEVLNCFTKLNILDYRIPFSGQRLKKDNLSKPMDITYFSTHTCLQKAQFI